MGCLGFVLSGVIVFALRGSWMGVLGLAAAIMLFGLWGHYRAKARVHVHAFCFGAALGNLCALVDDHSWSVAIAMLVSAGVAWFLHEPSDFEPTRR